MADNFTSYESLAELGMSVAAKMVEDYETILLELKRLRKAKVFFDYMPKELEDKLRLEDEFLDRNSIYNQLSPIEGVKTCEKIKDRIGYTKEDELYWFDVILRDYRWTITKLSKYRSNIGRLFLWRAAWNRALFIEDKIVNDSITMRALPQYYGEGIIFKMNEKLGWTNEKKRPYLEQIKLNKERNN